MTEIVLQVQGAEPRCFLLEIEAYENPRYMVCSVWALSAFDALEQGRRSLPREDQFNDPLRNAKIGRVALCVGHSDPQADGSYSYVQTCTHEVCSRKHHRLGVIK
jgi:hypothetical protein